ILSQGMAFVVTNDGKLGYQQSTRDPRPSIELLKEFLQRVQAVVGPPPGDSENWVPVETQTVPPTYEHASWVNSEKLEQILGSDLNTSTIKSTELRLKNSMEQMRAIVAMPGKYVAVTDDEKRFEYLIDRHVILELVAKRLPVET